MAKQRISNSERKRRKKLQILKDTKEFGNHSRLADEILMALNNPEMIGHYNQYRLSPHADQNKNWFKEQERKRKHYIDIFSTVPKFHISNGLVESVVNLSFQEPSKLLPRFSNARPPYEEVFIEWNEIHRKNLINDFMIDQGYNMAKVNEYNLPYRLGYYIQTLRHPDGEVMFVFSQFSSLTREVNSGVLEKKMPPNILVINPFAFMYSPIKPLEFDLEATIELYEQQGMTKEYIDNWRNANKEEMVSDYKKMQSELMYSLLGNHYCQIIAQATGSKKGLPKNRISLPISKEMENFANRGQIFNHMMSYLIFTAEHMEKAQKRHNEKRADFWTCFNGDARFLLTLLDILNQSELVEQNSIDRSAQLQYSKGLKRIPHSEYKVLNLILPKQQETKKPNPDANGSPKRYHQRRGHYRHFKDGRKPIWIKDKWVGNKELGTIYHDYNLLRKVH